MISGYAVRRWQQWAWVALALALAALAFVDVQVSGPRVAVQWSEATGPAARAVLERRFDLRRGEPDQGTTWRYDLGNRSRDNIAALIHDPAVLDTGYIDREALTTRPRDVSVSIRRISYPFSDLFDRRSQLVALHHSVWLWLAGGLLLWGAQITSARWRRYIGVAALLFVGTMALAVPIPSTFVHMGDANQNASHRRNFELYAAVHEVRFEAHLSYVILGTLDRWLGRSEDSPPRAQRLFAQATTAWFVLCAIAVGLLERWSPFVLRYLALCVLAPSALLYCGWLETGYHSLNLAAFPLLARGLTTGSARIEAGAALTGLGAALHGFGLVSLFGGWLAALATRARWSARVSYVLRIAAWGTAAYVGWIAIYVIALKMPVTLGNARAMPWRPWFVDDLSAGRVNAAIFSAIGGRDLAMTAWVVGAPLLLVAASLWRTHRDAVRQALAYAVPSVFFTIMIWPSQGLGEGMHLVFGRFAAVYALAWVCAQDQRRTNIAAALLVTAHYAFWRIVLDKAFRNPALF
jgi:hypothetical protein